VNRDGWRHVDPEQQPFGQLVALQPLHSPLPQVWPPGHFWQAPPPTPQAAAMLPGWHKFELQQPAQVSDVQRQVPETHSWPGWQGAPEPHLHAPLEEQPSARYGLQATQALPPEPQVARAG
jgi:hypothetical protein